MRAAAAAEEFEQATLERNRLRAVRSLLERRRVANESVGTFDAVAVALDGREANAQVFQVRDGVLSDRQSFYLSNETERDAGGGGRGVHAPVLRRAHVDPGAAGRPARAGRARRRSPRRSPAGAAGPVELRAAERGEKRRILELAERNARLALDQERLRSERRRQSRVEALEGLQQALGLDVPPIRIECFDISNLGGTHTVASMVVFEGGAPKKSDYRRFTIRTLEGASDDYAAMAEVLAPALRPVGAPGGHLPARPRLRRELRVAAEPGRDRRRQGPARGRPRRRCAAFASAASRSSRWPSASRRCSCPGARAPLVLDHSTPELQLLQRVRDEAHRFAITHHRIRRDQAMTSSLLDELPGVGPARKRALLAHFGSPEAVVAASQRGAAGGARPAREGRARAARPPAPRRLSRP